MAIQNRSTGWLGPLLHARIREALTHTLSRYHLICPAYCLMPDHGHFLFGGFRPSPESDQKKAISHFRREWNRILSASGVSLQKQAYDHVLRKRDHSSQKAFENVAGYILENPVKRALVDNYRDWPYSGALIPGYPDLAPPDDDFWDRFWKILTKLRAEFEEE